MWVAHPVPQLRLTELLYPLAVLSEPLKTDGVLTTPVREGFEIVKHSHVSQLPTSDFVFCLEILLAEP